MARPGCREKLTEGPRAIAKVWSCTDASPVLVDGPPKEPLPANDNPESSDQMMMGCNVPAGSSDLHDPAVCAHRAPTAWVEEGGVQTPERLVGGTMGN
ncbi:uncharacterized protein BO96DRAFT_430911 [Aspergillus niger CBS 101883]|uniref:Uncharacterized protein n=2 Tax=Aspergillus niger TaxID=5061 RepID=A5AAD6_ASPNC|nr:uncharacterized protein BO96DRAFT_430911 [Aspergillus niger CBS 101883]XP_059603470.1 hypothetical protein An02g10300 [Aspergillus niger]PYH59805.1 hypothetical protein BO96DRAFT_430911 [Aspergillus niger CBS 101883]CAK44378.1 hypothetical protein An02g10300 [Aspergillus niger]